MDNIYHSNLVTLDLNPRMISNGVKYYFTILFFLFNLSFIKSQEISNEKYRNIINVFNEAMGIWGKSPVDYSSAIKKLLYVENQLIPHLQPNPAIENHVLRQNEILTKDILRRYIRFMINCDQNNPTVCQQNNCLDRAWQMLERLKSLNYRNDILKNTINTKYYNLKDSIFILFSKLVDQNGNLNNGILNNITTILPEYEFLSQKRIDIRSIQNILKPNEVFVSYFITDNRRPVYAWKIEKNFPVKIIRLPINSADLFVRIECIKADFEIDSMYKEMLLFLLEYEKKPTPDGRPANPKFWEGNYETSQNLDILYKTVFKPLNIPSNKRVIIASDQNISALPFDILKMESGKRLFENYQITWVPSAKMFLYLRKKNIDTKVYNSFVGFSNNALTENTNDEIVLSSKFFPEHYLYENATEMVVYDILTANNNFDVIHFACHTETQLDNFGRRSINLIFEKERDSDGKISSSEFAANCLSSSSLIVLSGCNTAPSSDIKDYFGFEPYEENGKLIIVFNSGCVCSYGETFSDLTSSCFSSGTQYLLVTQWNIQDYFSKKFFEIFYEKLKEFNDPYTALKATKHHYSYLSESLWGGFILIGD